MTTFKITIAATDGTILSISAKGCIQTGTRNDEHNNEIPLIYCRNMSITILITDLPVTGKFAYIKQQVEDAYDALPNEVLVKQLIGKQWTS